MLEWESQYTPEMNWRMFVFAAFILDLIGTVCPAELQFIELLVYV
jgi:hypothetical protein